MTPTEREAIEAAKMTDEQLARGLRDIWQCGPKEIATAWLDVARRARELLAAPTLPAEPPPGFVRARFPIAVGEDGLWCVSAASHDQESESIEATDWFRREGYPSRVSFVTVDAPSPTSPAEITGEPQPAPAPSGMTEAVRTLARVVEELVNQSGALTCGITALIERQRDIRSVYDALDYAGPTPALPEVPQTAQEIARREIQRIEGGYYGISTAPDILVALHSIAGMEP